MAYVPPPGDAIIFGSDSVAYVPPDGGNIIFPGDTIPFVVPDTVKITESGGILSATQKGTATLGTEVEYVGNTGILFFSNSALEQEELPTS